MGAPVNIYQWADILTKTKEIKEKIDYNGNYVETCANHFVFC